MKKLSIVAMAALICAACANQRPVTDAPLSQSCHAANEQDIAALFERWNRSLSSGDAHAVVANYAEHSVLLPTMSNKPRTTAAEKEDYFHHFLANHPSGTIDWRTIEIDCDTAIDSGLYTFAFATSGKQVKARYTFTYKWFGDRWLITSHHSSAMPETE